MEGDLLKLKRPDLQKKCRQAREKGLIPWDSKCNGSRDDLIGLLTSPSEEIIRGEHPYYDLLSHLAPYLTLDKLLLFFAYYPGHPLLDEVKDPQGKVWADRVWVEMGEAPIPIGPLGSRYYHLWATNQLAPWGELIFGTDSTNIVKTYLKVQWAHVSLSDEDYLGRSIDSRITRVSSKGPSEHTLTLSIWALTPKGLKHFWGQRTLPTRGIGSTDLQDLYKSGTWTLRDHKAVSCAMSGSSCFTLDQKGNLSIHFYNDFTKRNNTRIQSDFPPLRYIRTAPYGVYTLGYDGRHSVIIYEIEGDNYSLEGPTDSHATLWDSIKTEDYYMRSSSEDPPFMTFGMFPVNYNFDGSSLPSQMVPDEPYLLPKFGLVTKIYETRGQEMIRKYNDRDKNSKVYCYLATDGRVYEVVDLISGETVTKVNIPGRYFRYERFSSRVDVWSGIVW